MNVILFVIDCVKKVIALLDWEVFGVPFISLILGGFVLLIFVNHFWKGAKA